MENLTSSGLTQFALANITLGVVTVVTVLVVILGVLIDRTAARHERTKGR